MSPTNVDAADASREQVASEVSNNPSKYHVLLTSYSQIGNREAIEPIRRISFNMAILDEGHQHLKNRNTQEWNRLFGLSTKWRLMLSGTPVQNNFQELVSILAFLDPRSFNSRILRAIEPIFKRKGSMVHISKGTLLAGDRGDTARDMLAPYLLQRRKEDLTMDLPPKQHRIIYCGMTKSQAAIHNAVVGRKDTSSQKGKSATMNPYMKLKQASSHPLIVRHHFTDETVEKMADVLEGKVEPLKRHLILKELKLSTDYAISTYFCQDYQSLVGNFNYEGNRRMDSGKAQTLVRLLQEFKHRGHKAIVFTPFAETAFLLNDLLLSKAFNICFMSGATPVAERQGLIDSFNTDSEINIFVLTTGTGGSGVNLTSADKVIIYDMSDNPQDDIQAENRAHRIGQKKSVEVIRLLTKGSIDETIFAASKKKIEMADKVTNWVGSRSNTDVVIEDGIADGLLDPNDKSSQKRMVSMCGKVTGVVKYDPATMD